MHVSDKAIKSLEKLGFKEYQARVYCALARVGQATAPEIHKLSGVPRPRVYDTLAELIEFGAVNYQKGRPVLYKAVKPALVVERLRNAYVSAGDEAIQELEKLTIQSLGEEVDFIWMLRGKENIHGKISELILKAEQEIFIKLSDINDYKIFLPELEAARDKGIHVKSLLFRFERLAKKNRNLSRIIDFGRIKQNMQDEAGILTTFQDLFMTQETLKNQLGIIIIDSKESLLLFKDKARNDLAVWSALPLMVIIQRTIFNYIWEISQG
ncbi:MAG: TrmB family transcriptional regulator [Candidatus Helarchaeales archaeon]